jgi:hypothetical protein
MLLPCAFRGGNAPVRPPEHGLRGWTREASAFSVPVQAVQPVQPDLGKREKKTFLLLPKIFERGLRPLSLPTEVLFARRGRLVWLDPAR